MGGQGRCSYHQACAPGTRTRAGWGGQPGKSPSPAAGAKGAALAQGLQLPSQGQALWGRGLPQASGVITITATASVPSSCAAALP